MVRQQTSDVSQFSEFGCIVICPQCQYEKPKLNSPYSTQVVCSLCDDVTIASYMFAVRTIERRASESKGKAWEEALKQKVVEARLEERLQAAKRNETERLQIAAQLHIHRIVDNLLTVKCSQCQNAFVDWTACFAVKCEKKYKGQQLGCLGYFCGWCIQGFSNSQDCHSHVRTCNLSLNKGNYFAATSNPMEEFKRAQAPIRKQKIEKYIADNKLTLTERQALRDLMKKDLTPLGVNLW